MTGQTNDLRDRLIEDLMLVVRDAEDLLRSTGQQASEGYQLARARFETTLSNAKSELATLEDRVTTAARDTYETTERYVQENPWQAVGIGACAGIVLGLMLGRR